MNKKLLILSGFLAIIITSSCMVYINASDIKNTSLLPIKDTYADSNYPTQTHGNSNILYFGNFSNKITETFLSFEISSKYRNITLAEIQIHCIAGDSGNETHSYGIKVNFSLISNNWDEATLNWENKPSPLQEITSFWTSGGSWVYGDPPVFITVDVIEVIQFDIENENILSICINTIVEEPIHLGYMVIASKEKHDDNFFFGPLLHLTYIEQPMDEFPILLLIIVIIGTAAGLGVGGGLGYFYYKKKRKRRN